MNEMEIVFSYREVRECYEFARRMIGNHNPNMIMGRDEWEIFRDDFRGKLGEVALKKYIEKEMPDAEFTGEIDYDVTPRGQWDITDLIVNGKYINVKAVKGNSRFLLIESKRYNSDGIYRYQNNDGENVRIDLYALVRIDISPEFGPDDMKYNDIIQLKNSKGGRSITATILGGISHEAFWRGKHYAPQGMWCNKQNLENVCQNRKVEMATEEEKKNVKMKTKILQQNNYVLDSKNELVPLENLI